jgi:O-antigen/teichoic acid export membrane protein
LPTEKTRVKDRIFQLVVSKYDESILRRSFMLTFLSGPALSLNLLYLVLANKILGMALFGIIYTSITVINILIGPVQVLNLYLIRRIATAVAARDPASAWHEYRTYLRNLSKYGLLACIPLIAAGLLSVSHLRLQSPMLAIVIVLTAFCLYLSESIRGVLQGVHAFFMLAVFLYCYLGLRLTLSLGALAASHLVWPGIAGIAAAGLLSLYVFDRYLFRSLGKPVRSVRAHVNTAGTARILLNISFTILVLLLLMYADNLVVYFHFPKDEVGLYSRASVWPKTMYVLTFPILQVFFPTMIRQLGREGGDSVPSRFVLKSFLMTFLATAAFSVMLFLLPISVVRVVMGDHPLLNTEMGLIRGLSLGAAAVCLIRVLTFERLAREKYLGSLVLVPALILQFSALWFLADKITDIPLLFLASNGVILVVSSCLVVADYFRNPSRGEGEKEACAGNA